MNSFIEPLYKSANKIDFGWVPEPGAKSYNMYVGTSSSVLVSLYTGIPPWPSRDPRSQNKIPYSATIEDVRTALGLPSTATFAGSEVFYFTITYMDASNAESSIAGSRIVKVPPVGIVTDVMKDDPTANRHCYVFSQDLQRWIKMAGTSSGAVAVDTSDYFKANITTVYTYDTTNVKTIKSYPSDATTPGSYAKLTTYTWTGSQVSTISITDSTV